MKLKTLLRGLLGLLLVVPVAGIALFMLLIGCVVGDDVENARESYEDRN